MAVQWVQGHWERWYFLWKVLLVSSLNESRSGGQKQKHTTQKTKSDVPCCPQVIRNIRLWYRPHSQRQWNLVLWKHVGENLGYQNPTKAVRDVVKERYKKPLCEIVGDVSTLSANQRTTIYINEGGLWNCVTTSRQKEAEQFQRWLCEIALPSWRRSIVFQGREPHTLLNYGRWVTLSCGKLCKEILSWNLIMCRSGWALRYKRKRNRCAQ